jgi:hypothetical protein
VGEGRRGAGPLAPNLDPGLNQRLVCPGGDAQLGDLPVPGGIDLVLAIAEGQTGALCQQGSPSGGGVLQLGYRGGFLAGGQPPAASGGCRRSRNPCDEGAIGGKTGHDPKIEHVFDDLQGWAARAASLAMPQPEGSARQRGHAESDRDDSPPYRYVSAEGPVVAEEELYPAERLEMAHRYLGAEGGDRYVAENPDPGGENVAFRMRPEHWLSQDQGKWEATRGTSSAAGG